ERDGAAAVHERGERRRYSGGRRTVICVVAGVATIVAAITERIIAVDAAVAAFRSWRHAAVHPARRRRHVRPVAIDEIRAHINTALAGIARFTGEVADQAAAVDEVSVDAASNRAGNHKIEPGIRPTHDVARNQRTSG